MIRGLLAALLLLGAVSAQARPLVFCAEANPETFGPALATASSTSSEVVAPLYSRLLEFKPGSTDLEPGLAQSVDVSPDLRTYTVHLRPGVAWHSTPYFKPTRPLTADDVVFTIERQWRPDHKFHNVGGGHYPVFEALGLAQALEAVDRIDDLTVRIRLRAPLAPFPTYLAMPFLSITSAEYADALQSAGKADRYDLQPIGTGPFQFLAYQKDSVIRYRAFPAYWGAKPAVDLVVAIAPDPEVRALKLRAGECQVMALPSPNDLAALHKDPDLEVLQAETLNVSFLAYNTTKKPLDDPRVRHALNMAIDRRAILDAVYADTAVAARGPIPPSLWGADPDLPTDPYDPAAARALLAQAGIAPGTAIELWAMPVSRPYNPNARRMAELIQADWAKVGIEAHVVSYEWGEYLKRTRAGEHQAMLYGWTGGDGGDPDNFTFQILGCVAATEGGNRARWCDKRFDDLVTQARATGDRAARAGLYRQAQRIFAEAAPWLPIAHALQFVPVRREVTGLVPDPLGRVLFDGVSLR